VDYPKQYAPDVLVAVPREVNRKQYGISEPPTEFIGWDTWHAYEVGFLTENGLPVAGLLKLVYPYDSPFLVESKSLKLYLNSFNMSRYGKNREAGIQQVTGIIKQDLEALLQCDVYLAFFDKEPEIAAPDFQNFMVMEDELELETIQFNDFSENPALLQPAKSGQKAFRLATHLLRSNCKVTHQPDWGSAFIQIEGETLPEPTGLLEYIVSFRNENHFHEEICEMLYQRLWDQFKPQRLMVACIYTRRGGIDICPSRASHPEILPVNLTSPEKLSSKLLRQ
jgi:7-cyano-7-deazaguanine reductase